MKLLSLPGTVTIICISLLLNGCASLSKEECQQGNWKHIGFKDGSRGLSMERYDRHVEACSKYKINPDYDSYTSGWHDGVERVYCRPRNAYSMGMAGATYNNVCPAHLEQEFIAAYQYGKNIWDLEKDLASARQNLQEIEKQLVLTGREIDELNDILLIMRDRRFSLKNRIGTHIVDELENTEKYVNKRLSDVARELHINPHEMKYVEQLLSLYSRRGKNQAKLDWLQSAVDKAPQTQEKIAQKRARILHLDREISQVTARSELSRRIQREKKPIIMLFKQSEYAGKLHAQLAILDRIERRSDLSVFIRFHYHGEPENIRITSKERFAHPAFIKSVRQLRKEIRLIEHDYASLVNEKNRTARFISELQSQAEEMRRQSPYR